MVDKIRSALLLLILLFLGTPLSAGDPYSAYYSSDTDKLLWFIHASDIHIGARGTTDSTNLQWLVNQARTAINPSFIVVTGDLTDSTKGNILGFPNGPHQEEWDEYKSILSSNGMEASFYYDIPGNHDAYSDRYFNYYLANSVQGRATGRTQASWTRIGTWGKYHFLGVNTADNTGAPFSFSWPYGDNAGLDSSELSFISSEMTAHGDASLTLVFGHHPLAPTGNSSDTYLFYGKNEFVSLMDSHGASLYGYGHTHVSSEQFFVQNMSPGVFYFDVAALGKDSPNQYTVTAIDCNGISSVTQTVGAWPVVLITAPMNRRLGGSVNPYAYTVPSGASNPIRALVFDPNGITQVQFRVNGGAWQTMTVVSGNPNLWQGVWNASTMPEGEYMVEVQATAGSGIRMDAVTTYLIVIPSPVPPEDFNGDGNTDLLWRNTATGEGSLWFMNGYSIIGGGPLPTIPLDWTIAGTGDFNNDGKADLLWRNTATGEGSLWFMNGHSIIGGGPLPTIPLDWTIAGTGDFNADLRTDILWRNMTTGEGSLWFMDGYSIIGGGPLPTIPLDWTIAGTGDFDNDGNTDVLWRNTATGEGSLWFMNGISIIGGGPLPTIPLDWTIEGTGDFNNDGNTDLIWRNTVTGEGSLWFMNGYSIIGGGPLPTIPLDWTIVGTGDFNNDGNTDLLWRNTATGEGSLWFMNGYSILGGGPLPTIPLDWMIKY